MQSGPGVMHEGRGATAGEEAKGGAGASKWVLTDSGSLGLAVATTTPRLWPPALTVLGTNEALGLTWPFV